MAGTVFVTGASGFIGRRLCARLLERGERVRALVRSADAAPPGTEAVTTRDLLDEAPLRQGLAGCDTVVHLAARVHQMRETDAAEAEYRRINIDGTRHLLDAAIAAGAQRFVCISSVKAVGERSDGTWTASTPAQPHDAYGRSKLEAERLVRARADAAGMHAPVLRLPLVYGPGMRANMLTLFDAVWRGIPLPLGAIENRRSLAFVGNVASAIVAAAHAPAAGRGTYFVSDGHDVSTPELIRAVARALGRPARLLRVPPRAFALAGRAGDAVSRVAPMPVTSDRVSRLLGSLSVDSEPLRRDAQWTPPYTLDAGLAETAAWYRAQRVRA